ncbi:MAG TPA: DNA polymerase III subunit epsilon [Thermoanaerobacterales bacterium]|nr:DNA polymerase III subunit epsilon [Thermoanaerobacterales bacterium]
MDFICIDFETANEKRASICAVALIYFKDNEVYETKEWLIKPPAEYDTFNPFNVQIHGITYEDVRDKPEIKEIWPEIESIISNKMIVAHNAAFDMSVLRAVLDVYSIPYPCFNYICTHKVSVKTWDKQVNYTLKNIGNMLGYIFNHHDPHDDAKIAGKILIEACKLHGVESIGALAKKIGMSIGYMEPGYYRCCSVSNGNKSLGNDQYVKVKDLIASTSEFDPDHPLYGKKVAFTGTLISMTRENAMQVVLNYGGQPANSVVKDTDYLVMGLQDYSKFVDGKESSKTKRAKSLINDGMLIQIIDEDEFIRMI